jgi:hypothetical protein
MSIKRSTIIVNNFVGGPPQPFLPAPIGGGSTAFASAGPNGSFAFASSNGGAPFFGGPVFGGGWNDCCDDFCGVPNFGYPPYLPYGGSGGFYGGLSFPIGDGGFNIGFQFPFN